MDETNLIHPMTAGDLVESARILAAFDRGDGVEIGILECVALETHDGARVRATFADRLHGGRIVLDLKASTPLLFTGIRL